MADNVEKDQKTEEATPRRRQEAREQGQVPMSSEFIASALLLGWLGAFMFGGGEIGKSVGGMVRVGIGRLATLGTIDLTVVEAARVLGGIGREGALSIVMFILPLFLLSLLLGYGQIGFSITPKAVALDITKLNPVKGVGRLFSMRSVVRTAMAFSKILLIGVVVVTIASMQIEGIVRLAGSEIGPILRAIGHVVLRCAAGGIVTVLAISLIDLVYQRFQHERDLRMSKQEIKDDMKNTEGDPHLKARIRRVQREMASRRMMQDVPDATVVITNPTHYAVALKYDRDEHGEPTSGAPVVLAKGVDGVAQRIKEVAREADVICYEDVPLARALHAQCEIGDEIPMDLFQAVASVLAYVYRVQGEKVPA